MEELLNKNIFDNKDLEKLAPDYTPSNILLRMEMRSTTVKDTHSHKVKTESQQRKIIKRPKDTHKVNKEIAKIRNGFQTMNLKNQIMIKNAAKYVDTLKSEDFTNYSDGEYDALEKNAETYLKDIADNSRNLIVQSDSDFKITDKPKDSKLSKEIKELNRTIKNNSIPRVDSARLDNDELEVEDLLRIECKILTRETVDDDATNTVTDDIINTEQLDHSNLISTSKVVDKDVNDLQALMIMMAISPPTNEVAVNFIEDQTIISSSCNDAIHFNPSTMTPIKNTMEQPKAVLDFLNITSLRVEINDKQKVIIKKYVEKWKTYVTTKKRNVSQQRDEALNSFFEKLTKKKQEATNTPPEPVNKAKVIARDFSRYRSRYLMQKHIIALQKAKLEEQNRIIEELKYNRIVEASRQSIDAMREEVRRTYYDMDKQLKPKLKLLSNELNIEVEEPSLVLHCLKVPQFIQRMEKRAREREEKHAIIRERRKQMEEERLRLKQQEELARAQMDKEEKNKRMKELKDKRKREKIDGIRKKQHAERMRALAVMADLHYEKVLITKYGIRPFRILIEMKRDNIEKAKAHYKFQLKKNVFFNWMWYTEDMLYERNYRAEDFYRKKLLKKAFDGLKKYHHNYVLKKQVAEDYYDLFVTNLVFKKLREAVKIAKKENEIKWQKSVMFYNSDLLFKTFTCWRTLPALNALRREQEARKARWREKVLQVVPDYTPPDD